MIAKIKFQKERHVLEPRTKYRSQRVDSSLAPPWSRGENSPNDSRIEPLDQKCGASFLPLLAKRGEGRGEEPQGTGGNSFDVQRSIFNVQCSQVHGEGRVEVVFQGSGGEASVIIRKFVL